MARQPDGGIRRPITQYDIATRLGIGQKTVSRALSGGALVAPALRSRILAAAAELGYRLNQSARSIRSQRFDAAILLQIVAQRHHRLAPGIVDGVADGLTAGGRALVIDRLVLAEPGNAPRALSQAMADGIIAHVDGEPPAEADALLSATGLPVVWINRRRPHDSICPDDHAVAVMQVRRLIAAGHRRIAWFDSQVGFRAEADVHFSRALRLEAYRSEMLVTGLTVLPMTPAYDPGETGHIAWLQSQMRALKPTAIATYGHFEAMSVIYAAGRMGLRIPEDVSLTTIHYAKLHAGLTVDTVLLPAEAMGYAAATMLANRIDGRRRMPSVEIPPTMVPGGSVSPPHQDAG